ncbi:hypothetical protein CDD83_296 [Cordyceps sp. RAO-2017]|nr:hypothetical protein CDD83_296 [Cordyceps sp. RAO-2017]
MGWQNCLHRLPLDGGIVASIACQVADIPDSEIPQGPVEEGVKEDPCDADASAITNLQITDAELDALQSRFLHGTPESEHVADLEHMPPSAQAQHRIPLPSIRKTPVDEFNRSQPLSTLAFPTLYPDGKADFVEPRLRSITHQDYLAHAMRVESSPEAARMVLSQQLLRDNAHIAAYHLHKRYTLFRTIVLKRKFNLTDFWARYECQGRGSSHHHGPYWLSGHPDLDPGDDRSRERFARIWGYHVSAVNSDKAQGLIPREKSVVNSSRAYSIYVNAQVVATKQNDLRRNRQMGGRFHQISVESTLLLAVFAKAADMFAYVLAVSKLSAFGKLTRYRDPKKVDEPTFAVLASRARGDIPKELRDVCHFLTTKVEEAICSGAPYSQYLGQDMTNQIREHLT